MSKAITHLQRALKHKIISPIFTPYLKNGSINIPAIKTQAEYAAKSGVNVAYVNGTTGEGPSLNVVERKSIAEAWKQHAPSNLEVVIQVGAECISDAKELARHAGELNVNGFAAIAPSYFRPTNANDLVEIMAEIASAAPHLPFYYYHFPVRNNVTIPAFVFLSKAQDRIPNLKGIKFTGIDLEDLTKTAEFAENKYEVWTGHGTTLGLTSIVAGATGTFIFDYWARPLAKMLEAYRKQDFDQVIKYQKVLREASNLTNEFGGLNASKILENQKVVECGGVRLPLRNLTDAQTQEFLDRFKSIDSAISSF